MTCERCKDLEISNTYLLKVIDGNDVSNKALREAIKSVEAHNDTLRNALQFHGEEAAQLALISEELRKDDRRVLNKVASECNKK